MEKDSIVTLNGRRFALTQEAMYNGNKYFIAVEVDPKTNQMLEKYGVLKEVMVNGVACLDIVRNKNEKVEATKALIKDFEVDLAEDKNNIPVGQFVKLNGKEYILLDYIPYENNMYMVFLTSSKPLDMIIAKRTINNNEEMSLEDVTTTDDGIAVLRLFTMIHNGDVDWDKMFEESKNN